MAAISPQRLRTDIIGLAHRHLDVHDYARAVTRLLGRRVPFDGSCLLLFDPATLLPTGEVVENGLPDAAMPRMTEIELAEADFNKFTDLARARRPAASLSEVTGGDLDRSLRHRELKRPLGFGDELRVALVSESGTWAGLTLLREAGRPEFAPSDADLLASLSRYMVEGLRRAVLLADLSTDHQDGAQAASAGVVLLAEDDSIESIDAAAQSWLAELNGGRSTNGGHPPLVIRAVAHRARQAAAGQSPGRAAAARMRTASGRWLLARGSVLGNGPSGRVAVIVEAAHRHQLAPLIADAYGLTEREQEVTQLTAQGLPTKGIARRLYLSPYTVQDHLKAIFEKVGVTSRGELVARVFFDQYLPRMTARSGSKPVVAES